jgi:hypothetical protein
MDMPTIAHPGRTDTARIDTDAAVSSPSSFLSGWTAADAALVTMWAALAVTILAYAVARESVGALILGAVVAWQMSTAWSGVARRREQGDDAVAMRGI